MKRWPLHKAYWWEEAPFVRVLVAFVAGIVCYDVWGPRPVVGLVMGALALAMAGLVWVAVSGRSGRVAWWLAQVALLCGGYMVSHYNDVRNDSHWYGHHPGGDVLMVVKEEPRVKEHSVKVRAEAIARAERRGMGEGDGAIGEGVRFERVCGEGVLYLYKDGPVGLHKGDTIWAPARWVAIRNAGNPYGFDYAGYARRNNIFYNQYCSANDVRLYATADAARAPWLVRAHGWCMAQLDHYLPERVARGLVQAMLLGDEVNLDEELRQSYSDTGIVHIIAISGGNVAIFFIVISAVLWWLRHKKHAWIKYAVALPLVWGYVVMAGGSASAVRAAMMFSLIAGAVMLQKNQNSLNQLLATAFVLLWAEPMWLYSVGFQLSFVAVLGLVLCYGPIYAWGVSAMERGTVVSAGKESMLRTGAEVIGKALWSVVAASLAAEVLVAPVVVYYFHTFPLMFVVANVAAYVFMSVVLVLGIVIVAIGWWPAAAKLAGVVTVWLVGVFGTIVGWLQGLNPVALGYLQLSGAELVAVYVVIAGLAAYLLRKRKPGLMAGLGGACVLMAMLCADEWQKLQQERLVVYNTGKGNHIELIRGGHYEVLYTDTTAQKKKDYAVRPAHTGWRAWRMSDEAGSERAEVFVIGGKRVLVLNEDMDWEGQYAVDYLVINYTGRPDIGRLQRVFSPKQIVVGNNYSRKEQEELKLDWGVHAVGIDGAWECGD